MNGEVTEGAVAASSAHYEKGGKILMKKNGMFLLGLALGLLTATFLVGCNKEDVNEMLGGEEKGYKVEKEEIEKEEEKIMIEYPQLEEAEDEIKTDEINEMIKKTAQKYDNSEMYKDLFLAYTEKQSDEKLLSVLFEGKATMQDDKKVNLKDSININIATGEEITYENYIENKEEVKKILEEKLKAKDAEAKFEGEGIRIYFEDDNVVFFYMPADDAIEEFVDISVSKEEMEEYVKEEKVEEEKPEDEDEDEEDEE